MTWVARRLFDGFVLLLPLILSYLLLGALFDLMMTLTGPVAELMPTGWFSSEWDHRLTALIVLVVLCFAIGVADRMTLFRRAGDWLETRVLERFAPYSVLRSFASRLSAADVPEALQPALLDVGNDARQLAFIVEELDDGRLTLFVPLASMPGVGHVQIVSANRLEKLDATVMDALGPLFNWGDGMNALIASSTTTTRR